MKDQFLSQQKLLKAYDQTIYKNNFPKSITTLREKLIKEEASELSEAIQNLPGNQIDPLCREKVLKEFSDLLVVAFGSMVQLGFKLEELEKSYAIVCDDNLSKAYSDKKEAFRACDYYIKSGKSECYVSESAFEGEVFYCVKDTSGKVMKRYPREEEETTEEKIKKAIQ